FGCANRVDAGASPAPVGAQLPAAESAPQIARSEHSTEGVVAPASGLAIGDTFIDFGLPQLDLHTGALDGVVWLSDLIGPARHAAAPRLLLLNFFAAWCVPCFEELRTLNTWRELYGSRGLGIVSVNVRIPGEDALEAARQTRQHVAETLSIPLLFE